jgi:hypothetical protein
MSITEHEFPKLKQAFTDGQFDDILSMLEGVDLEMFGKNANCARYYRGVANLEAGNANAGNNDLDTASLRSISAQNPSLEAKSRLQEEQLLRDSIARQKQVTAMARCDTYLALSKSYGALAELRGKNAFQSQDAAYYAKLGEENRIAASQPGVVCR